MNLFLSYIYYKNLLKNYQTNIFILNLKLNIFFTCMFFLFFILLSRFECNVSIVKDKNYEVS